MPTFIDAHVHVHDASEATQLLDAAVANFSRAARQLGLQGWDGVLMLAEMKQAQWFESLAGRGEVHLGDGWEIRADPHDELVLRARCGDRELLLVAGRQVATREGLEVLTLSSRMHVADGMTLDETLHYSAAAGALCVVPWGMGKWLGSRGTLVRTALARQQPQVWAGDSATRPAAWPAMKDFEPALRQDRPLLNGTDPLPLPGEHRRVASFGSWLEESLPATRPGYWLQQQLRRATPAQLRTFGRPVSLMRCVRSQVGLRTSRRRRRPQQAAGLSGQPAPAPAAAITPAADLETSSADYARRFAGPAGRYLLSVQAQCVARALRDLPPGRALDVGGGHGQLAGLLRDLGWAVTVHGTDPACERNLRQLHGQRDCEFLLGDLFHLPVPDRSFDLVIAVRLVSHVDDWQRLLAEMCRVASRAVVIDYPSSGGLNALTPLLFGLKKSLEGNTRTYTSFSRRSLQQVFAAQGFGAPRQVKQFFLPMVVHRIGKAAAPLRLAERMFRATGLTAAAGSPVILRVDRT